MKKRIGSLLLILALCFTLLPTAAFAEENEQSSKISITTADELLQFAKAVDNGEYDDKTDAVVSLDADLDLTGVAWKPIGSVFDDEGLQHYFSGKFYGNGHTISNLDFSKNYGKAEYPSFGFFSEIYGAEVSDLTIEGTLEVDSEQEYTFFGVFTGVASNCTFSNCVSNVTFKNDNNLVYGTFGLIGYAIDTTVEYCRNVANITITGNMGSLYVGGIVGFAESNKDISKISYCSNTGNMTLASPHGGGIVGQLGGKSQVSNCYSAGKLIPIGNTEIGGIAGTVGSSATVNHCYYFGDIDLSQFIDDNSKLYSRFGGIVGNSSNSAIYQNNYYTDTENVTACGVGIDASTVGIAKQSSDMKTPDFYDTLKKGGGDYVYVENSTPILPAPKYTVSFVVTPAELANVVIKVNGQVVTNPANLEAGTYQVEVSADNCEVFNSNITITADTATHTQTIAMTYRKSSGGDDSDPTYAIEVGEDIRNGTVTANRRYAERGDTVTITVKPDDGFKLDDLTVTDKNGNELKLTDKGNGKYTFKMPAGKVTVSATFAPEKTAADYFADVPANSYYADAVLWAAKNGITGGIGNGLFGPNQPCTRAQIVTFLWRAAGSPEPKAMSSFADVSTDAYYAKAVAWAVENGITTGTGDGKFSPDATCTRAQSVTFLFRAIGKLVDSKAEFSDVLTDSYYANAVAWAVENGVTNGIGDGLFGPDNSCTRAQIVTFLFRAYQGK